MGANDEDLHTAELTIGFADLVGFSAYSNAHSQDEIGELVEQFESRAFDAVARRGGRVIKTLGDSVLFVCERPEQAYDVAADIVLEIGHDELLPDVRVGLATGPVVLRLGDVFGRAVNLAARMTAVARRNRVITDRRTADLLPRRRVRHPRAPRPAGAGVRRAGAGGGQAVRGGRFPRFDGASRGVYALERQVPWESARLDVRARCPTV